MPEYKAYTEEMIEAERRSREGEPMGELGRRQKFQPPVYAISQNSSNGTRDSVTDFKLLKFNDSEQAYVQIGTIFGRIPKEVRSDIITRLNTEV